MNNSTADYKVAQETAVFRGDYRFLPALATRPLAVYEGAKLRPLHWIFSSRFIGALR